MVTEKERMIEWLQSAASQLDKVVDSNLSHEERLLAIRHNYSVLDVLTKVASGKAYMTGAKKV